MVKVIIDTNFLLIPSRFNVDIFGQIKDKLGQNTKFCIMEGTLSELNKIIQKESGADKNAAKLGLELLKAKGLKTLAHPLDQDVDSAILDLEATENTVVATQDMELRSKLRSKGVRVIYLRQKKYISID